PHDLLQVGGVVGVHGPTGAEAAAVDGQAAGPRGRDAGDEGEHQQGAGECAPPGQQTQDEDETESDLDDRQHQPDHLRHLVVEQAVGDDGLDRPGGVRDLQEARGQDDPAQRQPANQPDQVEHPFATHAARTPSASWAVSSRSAVVPLPEATPSPSARTSAEPTITPSANEATSAACSRVETPRPTQIGRSVTARVRATRSRAPEPTLVRAPVTPIVEAA